MGAPYLRAPSIAEILSVTRVINAAELLAFSGGAIGVVPPPGGGQVIWPISLMAIYNFGSVDFSGSAGLDFQYHGVSQSLINSAGFGLTGGGESAVFNAAATLQGTGKINASGAKGAGIDLVLASGAFALHGVGAATIGAAGTGYVVGDTGTITTGNGDATYRITSIGAGGAVTGFVITFPGSGYSTGNGQATATGGGQPGVGINFTVDVTSLVNGDGTIKVTTLYQVIDVP